MLKRALTLRNLFSRGKANISRKKRNTMYTRSEKQMSRHSGERVFCVCIRSTHRHSREAQWNIDSIDSRRFSFTGFYYGRARLECRKKKNNRLLSFIALARYKQLTLYWFPVFAFRPLRSAITNFSRVRSVLFFFRLLQNLFIHPYISIRYRWGKVI